MARFIVPILGPLEALIRLRKSPDIVLIAAFTTMPGMIATCASPLIVLISRSVPENFATRTLPVADLRRADSVTSPTCMSPAAVDIVRSAAESSLTSPDAEVIRVVPLSPAHRTSPDPTLMSVERATSSARTSPDPRLISSSVVASPTWMSPAPRLSATCAPAGSVTTMSIEPRTNHRFLLGVLLTVTVSAVASTTMSSRASSEPLIWTVTLPRSPSFRRMSPEWISATRCASPVISYVSILSLMSRSFL